MEKVILKSTIAADRMKPKTGDHVCPYWVGYLLASPLRRLIDSPKKLLAPYVGTGMTVLDMGCAMGYFSLPLARMVGASGCVIGVDVQERMLGVLRKRARRQGLDSIVETRFCTQNDLKLDDLMGRIDLALAFHVVHEMTRPDRFFRECYEAVRPGGKLIVVEPVGHVSEENCRRILDLATAYGFTRQIDIVTRGGRGAVYEKPGSSVPRIPMTSARGLPDGSR
jgi:2-polyprenyl-3-methyl-5-hydroxy-6-metoxy-1,4-benzoquinol methylase